MGLYQNKIIINGKSPHALYDLLAEKRVRTMFVGKDRT